MLRGIAFITGAASGIGKATAYSLAQHGVRQLAIADINFPAAQDTAHDLQSQFSDVQALPLNLNVADPASIKSAITKTVARFGRIDYAVNSAGIVGSTAYSSEHDIADWQKTLDVNLNGVWMASREEIAVMMTQEKMDDSPRSNRGVIVNVASAYGLVGSSRDLPIVAYTASKHAVVGFTKADALTYAPLGIRINAICPGYVETPLLGLLTPEGKQKEESKTPLGRMGQPDEIGDAITFMLSPMSSYMYGSAMVVDGGFTAQ
ncbi:NAD(P)-binding protein [Aspergillus sclerotiicarbonarius CBS 121057]|uniref:NAD(P)-binding protein n=1 Tax=Aspergillus sclerotiicarbonarius (strain CBS 121057 / IBT 28362) TaxID=1448318 RepID=A0A319E2E2_ASPSB|nr:NAD(P)-binding protein [Aspergillus sclerotiicarbonarius CBS 121057]